MRRIHLSNLFHSVCAAKLKHLSKKVLEQFLLSGGITENKSSLAECVFVELLFFLLYSIDWYFSLKIVYMHNIFILNDMLLKWPFLLPQSCCSKSSTLHTIYVYTNIAYNIYSLCPPLLADRYATIVPCMRFAYTTD